MHVNRAKPGKKKADRTGDGDGDDAAGRGVAGGGQARTSPETGTVRLATASPPLESKKILRKGVQVLVEGVRLGFPKVKGRLRGKRVLQRKEAAWPAPATATGEVTEI
jgi:hypothetical protein